MARRPLQEINAGSMADIAFLLLIFFLVTTTMDQDAGILRQLPPPVPPDQPPPPKVIERNVYEVLVNANNQLLVEGQLMNINQLRDGTKEFMTNPQNKIDLPEMRLVTRDLCLERIEETKAYLASDPTNTSAKEALKLWEDRLNAVEIIGEYRELPTSALISLQNDRGTSYDMYIQVQNELQAAINELRNSLSLDKFNVAFSELNTSDDRERAQVLAIRQVYPMRISEAEPKSIGGE
jgi:biopolymer transport protein ExbD